MRTERSLEAPQAARTTNRLHDRTRLGRLVATYDYADEKGALLYQVVRFDPKDFRQRRPDGNGGWIWRLGDVRRVLYRLRLVLTAPPPSTIWIVEGEKDADALMGLGLVATCNVGGAGKWRQEYGGALRGRRVIVLPDNDEPGRKHAAQVVAALRDVAQHVAMLELPGLPAKGDVSDWIAARGTAEQLRAMAREAIR